MATEYGKRLRAARLYAGLKQMEAQKLTGIRQSTISTAERTGHGSSDTPVYASKYGVNALWLATGEGSMTAEETAPPEAQNAPAPTNLTAPTLGQILEALSDKLLRMPASTRHRAGLLLASLAESPEGHAEIAAMLEAASGARVTEAADTTPEIPITATSEQDRKLRATVAAKKLARTQKHIEAKRAGKS